MTLPPLSPGRRVAHDINNVLFVLYGRCDNMRDQLPLDHPVLDDIEAISMAAARLEELVEEIRALDPPEPGTDCTDSSESTP